MTTTFVRSTDDVNLAVEEAGPRGARAIVFLHGFGQSRHSWRALLDGPLATDHRLVAVDLRGHGDSDKPTPLEAYAQDERLGQDLEAVLDALDVRRPTLVAWSYGGVVVGEYLRRYGSGRIGGLLLSAAAVMVGRTAKGFFGPGMLSHARALLSDDPEQYEAGARAFVGACSKVPLDESFVEQAVAQMKRVPVHVRRAYLSRSEDFSPEIARCSVPIVTVHGSADEVVLPAMSEHVHELSPSSVYVGLEEVGHVPWLEAQGPFLRTLRELSARVGD
jgi:pimeloyl-ACP methyl ester carboxylesterase